MQASRSKIIPLFKLFCFDISYLSVNRLFLTAYSSVSINHYCPPFNVRLICYFN